jgi:hypothetical protein
MQGAVTGSGAVRTAAPACQRLGSRRSGAASTSSGPPAHRYHIQSASWFYIYHAGSTIQAASWYYMMQAQPCKQLAGTISCRPYRANSWQRRSCKQLEGTIMQAQSCKQLAGMIVQATNMQTRAITGRDLVVSLASVQCSVCGSASMCMRLHALKWGGGVCFNTTCISHVTHAKTHSEMCGCRAGYFTSTVLQYWFPFQSNVLKY